MGFLITLFSRREKSSATAAKDRLLEVLIHDRVKLSPATMEKIRQEILEVLSKYIDVDREGMEVSLVRAEGAHQLTANIPIRRGEVFDRMEADEANESGPDRFEPRGTRPGGAPGAGRSQSSGDTDQPGASSASASSQLSSQSSGQNRSPGPEHFGPRRKKRY